MVETGQSTHVWQVTCHILKHTLPAMTWVLVEELGGENVTISGGAVTILRQE